MNKKISVYWMHCKSCEVLIENKLSEIPWIKIRKISAQENFIDIDIKDADMESVNKIINELWYSTKLWKTVKNKILDNIIIILIFIIFWMAFFLFKDVELFKDVLKSDNLSFFVIILVWIVASLSTCLAVTWGIVVGFSKYIDTSKSTSSHLKTQLKFHFWRIIWFALWGWILWLIWWYLWSFWMLNKILLLVAWIFMIYMGFNILNIFPSISKLWISMPKFLWKKILNIKNPVFAPIIGALTFFLPCWFTQSMQIYAASSSSFLSWAMIMWTFALWTMPVLFLIGFWSSYFKDKNYDYINKFIGVLIVYFGIFILSGFSNMFNFNLFNTNNVGNNSTQNTINLQELKEVEVVHNWEWFENDVILEWAKNYRLTINPISDWQGCFYWLTIPWIDEKEYLVKKWIPIIINIKNSKPGTYKVVCTAMWMKQWIIIIK